MVSTRDKLGVRLLTAFVIGFVDLTLEIAYTRVISFKLFYYYTYFVIGLALLGLGAASAVVALSPAAACPGHRAPHPRRRVPRPASSGSVGYLVVARLPTDVNLIWAGSAGRGGRPVLAAARVLSLSLDRRVLRRRLMHRRRLFVVEVDNVRRLYFWDLAGAALGCLLAVPLQATIGPPAMILVSLVRSSARPAGRRRSPTVAS